MQTAEQMLAATKDNLKRTEHDFTASRSDLTTANRDLKEALRQVDSLQIQLSKSIQLQLNLESHFNWFFIIYSGITKI